MERLVEMGGAEGRTVCVRDQFQVIRNPGNLCSVLQIFSSYKIS
jgi:hypothetical protein